MQCIILCGGFATRLRPLTLDQPKHLLPVAGRPMLDYLLDSLAAVGLKSAVIVTNRRFIRHFEQWASAGPHAMPLRLFDDGTSSNETRLGAIGDLRFGLDQGDVQEEFLVVNGDNLFTFHLHAMLDTFRQRGNTIAVYDVQTVEVARMMGIATTDATGRVVNFVEKPSNPSTTMISIGIYAYQPEVRGLVDRYLHEGNSPDRTGDFVAWLHRQTPVFTHPFGGDKGRWFDIGSFDQLQEANLAFGGKPIRMDELK